MQTVSAHYCFPSCFTIYGLKLDGSNLAQLLDNKAHCFLTGTVVVKPPIRARLYTLYTDFFLVVLLCN